MVNNKGFINPIFLLAGLILAVVLLSGAGNFTGRSIDIGIAPAACSNGGDDDGDSLIDLADPGCTDVKDNSEDTDTDSDGLENGEDNCIQTANADQADTNEDGVGDACTPDGVLEIVTFESGTTENFMDGVVGDFDPTTDGLEIATIDGGPLDTVVVFDNQGNQITTLGYHGYAIAAGDIDGVGIDDNAFGDAASQNVTRAEWDGSNITVVWTTGVGCGTVTDVEIGNVNAEVDSTREVISTDTCSPLTTNIFNGTTGAILAAPGFQGFELALEDISASSDGIDDVIVTGDTGTFAYDFVADTLHLVNSEGNSWAVYAGATPSFTGVIQIAPYSADPDSPPYSPPAVVTYVNGSLSWNTSLDSPIVDLDTVEAGELGTLTIALTQPVGTVYALDIDTGEIVWNVTTITGYGVDTARSLDLLGEGDVDDDGADEVIVGGDDSRVYVLDAATGAQEMNFSLLEIQQILSTGDTDGIENIDVADMDGDGVLDIVAESDGSVFGVILYMSGGEEAPPAEEEPEGAPAGSGATRPGTEEGGNIPPGESAEFDLEFGDTVTFSSNGESHSIRVTGVFDSTVELEISSTPIREQFFVGETKSFDTNQNGFDDLQVSVLSKIGNAVTIRVTALAEALAPAPAPEEEVPVPAPTPPAAAPFATQSIIVILVLTLATIVAIIALRKVRTKRTARKK